MYRPNKSLRKLKRKQLKGFSRNPFFYFGSISFLLFGLLFIGSSSLAKLNNLEDSNTVFLNAFFKNVSAMENSDLFFGQKGNSSPETPDLKIVSDAFVAAVSTPNIVTTQTLGSILGGDSDSHDESNIVEYIVQSGDTIESIAQHYNISVDTLIWANNLSKNSTLKIDQTLTILPVSGLVHAVKSGDTISEISKTYKVKAEDVIAFNAPGNENDIFIGDTLIIPDGVMPLKPTPSASPSASQGSFADSFFGNPTQGKITQGLHYYNAVDVANKCGTPIYAAASGTVQRAVANGAWNSGKGNHITILHANGTTTYYGHFTSLSVGVGDQVNAGDVIGLMGSTGKTTGCNLHFQAIGTNNPLAKYKVGTFIK